MPAQRDLFYASRHDGALRSHSWPFPPLFCFYCLNFHCFSADEKGKEGENHLALLGWFKRKGKEKHFFFPLLQGVAWYYFEFFWFLFFLTTCLGRPRCRTISPSLLRSGKVKRHSSCWAGGNKSPLLFRAKASANCRWPYSALSAIAPRRGGHRQVQRKKERKRKKKRERKKERENIPFFFFFF